jgi:hypothetical protein
MFSGQSQSAVWLETFGIALQRHYKAGLIRAGFIWTNQARYNRAPDISLKAISGNSGRLYAPYAVKLTQLLGTPFKVAAVWHEHDRYPYQLVPHKFGAASHGYYARQRSYGYFALWMQKDHEGRHNLST